MSPVGIIVLAMAVSNRFNRCSKEELTNTLENTPLLLAYPAMQAFAELLWHESDAFFRMAAHCGIREGIGPAPSVLHSVPPPVRQVARTGIGSRAPADRKLADASAVSLQFQLA